MKRSHALIGGAVLVAIGAGLAVDLVGRETNTLENAHRAAGLEPSCSALQEAGETWALCSIGKGAPSVWLKRGDAWATGNGVAQNVAARLEASGPGAYQNLPRLYVDREHPVTMPPAVLAKL